jgi:haloacid dehalogenase superfamily, subfamily IA, variant 3 with third motif having DD or ED
MNKLEGIKNIIFDLGGVILNIDYFKTVEAFRDLGIANFDEIFSQYKQMSFSDDFETGKISPHQFYQEIVNLSGVDLDFEEFKQAWNALLLDLPSERIQLLKKLSSKYRLFLYSNTNATHYDAFIDLVGQDFDRIFEKTYYSHIFGYRKPNHDGFELILSQNQLIPQETLFVDDSNQHILSANSLGIKTCLISDSSIVEVFG